VALAALGVLVLAIGVSLGLSGIGGFLIPPLLVALAGFETRAAVADALISFVPSGVLGAMLSWRSQPFSRSLTVALCVGTVPGVVAGRELSLALSQGTLQDLLAGAVVVAAIFLLLVRPHRPGRKRRIDGRFGLWLVAATGFVGGALTVLAGVGGPLVAVPALVLLGVATAAAVAAALVASVVGSALGAIALAPSIDNFHWPVLALVIAAQLAGVATGVWLRSRVPARRLPQLVAVVALVAAAWLLWSD
jgi:uncharacterized protein